MEAEEAVVLLAAAPAVAYREYLYRPDGRLARWIEERFEVLAVPGARPSRPPRAGDLLIEVRLGGAGAGRCRAIGSGRALSGDGLPPGQLLLRLRRPAELTAPQPVEPVVAYEHAFGDEAGPMVPPPLDAAAAVPPFAAGERSVVIRPLLTAAQAADAVAWTRRMHPAASGVGPDDLRAALRGYVDEAAVAAVVPGDADRVLVECVHQFQVKCYCDPREHDGRAGESTLDSLGLIVRAGSGFRGADRGNAHALQRLRGLPPSEFPAGLSPATWFDAMADPSVFGWRTAGGAGLHLLLVRRLRQAERHLLTRPEFRGMTPAALGRALGLAEAHQGARPSQSGSSSVHTFGLAVDIGYLANPWINDPASWTAIRHAAAVVSGIRLSHPTVTAYFSSLGESGRPTGEIWDELHRRSTELATYLGLGSDADALRAAMRPALTSAGETAEAAAERWRAEIRRDRERLVATDFGRQRRPENGFLALPRALVVALRDRACLAWGAVDFGPGADGSGDMMHFDARIGGVGGALAHGVNYTPARGHPCLGAAAPAEASEAADSEASAAEHLGGRVWTFVPEGYGLPVAVFCPAAALAAAGVSVLFFAHGLLRGCPRPREVPAGFVTDRPFALGSIVAASGRPVVLVVPLLDWARPGGEDAFGRGHERWQALAEPGRFTALIGEVMAEVGRVRGTAVPAVTSLIVAGHSRAYDFLEPLAATRRRHGGVLARLTEVWAFDTTYAGRPDAWADWVSAEPSPRVNVFYRPDSPTAAVGEAFGRHARAGLVVTPVPERHCDVPATRMRELLPALPAPAGPGSEGVADADAGVPLSAEELTTRIVRCIGVWETNRDGDQPAPRESELDTVAGVHASMATVEQATVPYAITVLRRHKTLRDRAQPPLTLKELNAADARAAAVRALLGAVAGGTGATAEAFIAAHGPGIAATGLGDGDVRTMFRAEALRATLAAARTARDAAGNAAGATRENAERRSVAASIAAIAGPDRLGLSVGSLTAYLNDPAKWGENAAGWARRAVLSMPGNVGARIEAVATSGHGQALAVPANRALVDAEIARTPKPTTEQLVRAVAQRNNPGESAYGRNVWKTYQRLYP